MNTTTNPDVDHFLTAADRFTGTVEATTDWSAASPCEGWTAADVVDHVVDAERDFLTTHGADLGERPTGAPPEVWAAHLAAVRALVGDDGFVAQEFGGHFGVTTVSDTLSRFYGFDLVVHGWDLGTSNGRPTTFTDADMDRMESSIQGFGAALYADGVCKPGVAVPSDASRQDRLLALLGRRAR